MTKTKDQLSSLKALSAPLLATKVRDLYQESLKMKMEQVVQKGGKDVHAAAKKRRELAWSLTLLKEKERGSKS